MGLQCRVVGRFFKRRCVFYLKNRGSYWVGGGEWVVNEALGRKHYFICLLGYSRCNGCHCQAVDSCMSY